MAFDPSQCVRLGTTGRKSSCQVSNLVKPFIMAVTCAAWVALMRIHGESFFLVLLGIGLASASGSDYFIYSDYSCGR